MVSLLHICDFEEGLLQCVDNFYCSYIFCGGVYYGDGLGGCGVGIGDGEYLGWCSLYLLCFVPLESCCYVEVIPFYVSFIVRFIFV